MVYIVYHSADFDGMASLYCTLKGLGVTVSDVSKGLYESKRIQPVPYNYQDQLLVKGEPLVDKLERNDWIFFVDCMYTKDLSIMNKMIEKVGVAKQIVMIDHHETSIKWVQENELPIDFSGSRSSSDFVADEKDEYSKSAAALCFEYFFGYTSKNIVLELISKYDTWYKDDGKWDEITLPFQYGLRSKGFNLYNVQEWFMDVDLLIWNADPYIRPILDDGQAILRQIKADSKQMIRSYAKEAYIKIGDEEYFALIAPGHLRNSNLFEYGLSEEDAAKYQIFILDKPNLLENESITSIVSNSDDIDASALAEKLGGGGHRQISSARVKYTNVSFEEDERGKKIYHVTFVKA